MANSDTTYPGHLFNGALLALVLAVILTIASIHTEWTALGYRRSGVESEARVLEGSRFSMLRGPSQFQLAVTFPTAPGPSPDGEAIDKGGGARLHTDHGPDQ